MTLLGHRDAYNHTMHAHIILSHSRCIIHYVSHVRNENCPSLQKIDGRKRHACYKCFVQKLLREKANKLISMCLPAPMERHFARNFEDRAFSGSFKV